MGGVEGWRTYPPSTRQLEANQASAVDQGMLAPSKRGSIGTQKRIQQGLGEGSGDGGKVVVGDAGAGATLRGQRRRSGQAGQGNQRQIVGDIVFGIGLHF
jgi:hypothetical protein